MKNQISVNKFKGAVKSLNEFLKHNDRNKITVVGVKRQQVMEVFTNTVLDFIDNDIAEELPDDVIDFYNEYIADSEPELPKPFEKSVNRVNGKIAAYAKRLRDSKHPQKIKFKFSAQPRDVIKIVKVFGELTVEYVDDTEKTRFFPPLNISLQEMGADFKYCYEKFEKWLRRVYGSEEWSKVFYKFQEERVYELYQCVNQDATISYLYNLPMDLIFDKGKLSGNELKVLLAFMARAKKTPELGGISICGWSAEGLEKELGMHRNTVGTCINELERKKFLKLLPALGNKRKKKYQVCVS